MNKIFFISGVCGVGKTTVIFELKLLLSQDGYEIYDFDSRGVPEDADHEWRISETHYWIDKGRNLAKKDKNIIVCGFTNPDEFGNKIKSSLSEIELILLDAQPEIIKERLIKRYTKDGVFDENQKVVGKPVNKFIKENVSFVGNLQDIFKKNNCPIIDTSELTPKEVAKEVVKSLKKV